MQAIVFGLVFFVGVFVAISARAGVFKLTGSSTADTPNGAAETAEPGPELSAAADEMALELPEFEAVVDEQDPREPSKKISLSPVALVQLGAAAAGLGFGWWATGLVGMAVLLSGLGVLLPPFMAAPRRRRRQTRTALAWQLWSRQLAELARSGAGLGEALRGSVDHAPPEIADIVEKVASAAEMHGLESAIDELANSGIAWEPEVAAGLMMATTTGGSVAEPLLDLCGRIGDVVELHRSKTEAVVELWTQTIALLALAGGVIALMYSNNPAYFEPYRSGTGQTALIGIAGILLFSVGFLVYHSVVRDDRSILVPASRRKQVKEPL